MDVIKKQVITVKYGLLDGGDARWSYDDILRRSSRSPDYWSY